MSTNRIDKVNSLLEHEISKILQREIFFPNGSLVTLTRVETTPNLIEAKVFISVLPEDKIGKVLETLKREVFGIQKQINKKLNMRPIPKIIFVKDEAVAKAGRVEQILAQLKKEEK